MKFEMVCLLPGAAKLPTVNQPCKVKSGLEEPTSTGEMSKYLAKHFPDIYSEFIEGKSPYSSSKLVNGKIVKTKPFKETFKETVLYVKAIAADLRPACFGKTDAMTALFQKLNPEWRTPCRDTVRKLSLALVKYDHLMFEDFNATHKARNMTGCVATTEDGWMDGKGKNHYESTSATFISRFKEAVEVDLHSLSADDIAGGKATVASGEKLVLAPVTLIVAFDLSDSTEKAQGVADGYEDTLATRGIALANVAMAALDGAAVGVAAKKRHADFIESSIVCGPHNTARAILYGLGIGTKVSKNPGVKSCLLKIHPGWGWPKGE
jgi:hypothetical protein